MTYVRRRLYLSRPNWSKTQADRHIYIKSSKVIVKFKIYKSPTNRHNRNDFLKLVRQAESNKIMKSPRLSQVGVILNFDIVSSLIILIQNLKF